MKFNRPSLAYLICVVFIHLLFIVNKQYLVGYYNYMDRSQYKSYINSYPSDNVADVIAGTETVYFKCLPDWTINLVYVLYFIGVLFISIPETKHKLIQSFHYVKTKSFRIILLACGSALLLYIGYFEIQRYEKLKDENVTLMDKNLVLTDSIRFLKTKNAELDKKILVLTFSKSYVDTITYVGPHKRHIVTDPVLIKELNSSIKK